MDGDAIHRQSMRRVLRAAGYRVLEAADYQGAQNAHQQHLGQVDLLLTAVALPGGNGYELSKILLDLEPAIKLLFVSGETGAKVSEFYDPKWTDSRTLRRPFNPADFLRRVKDVLESPLRLSTSPG